jgi:putative transposase
LTVSSRAQLSAEVLFLRKLLAFYKEHQVRPCKLTDAARFSLVLWSRLLNWRAALMIVKPETLVGWHRQGFKLFWRWKSRFGRQRIPENLRRLRARLAQENPIWGEERIAAELAVKLGILVSPRTVRAYWPQDIGPRGDRRTSSQHWRTFVRNHAKAIVATDFLVAITASFRILYVFVVMEVGSRRILHCNITPHPTAAWTLQQFREAIASDDTYRFLIHDRDSIFSAEVDDKGISSTLHTAKLLCETCFLDIPEFLLPTLRSWRPLPETCEFNHRSVYRPAPIFYRFLYATWRIQRGA